MNKNKEQKNNENLNVNECVYYDCGNCNSRDYEQYYSIKCAQINCCFKDYARKTQECEELSILAQEESAKNALIEYELNDKLKQKMQECEELEEKIKKLRKNLALEIEANDRYRKALEEIEEFVKSQLDGFGNDVCLMHKVAINEILNIINKAKGEK